MILSTAEIRFWSKAAEPMHSWFLNLIPAGEGTAEPPRTDYYLKTFSQTTTVKFRSGNRELKSRTGRFERPVGLIETYVKESIPSKLKPGELKKDDWIAVWKERRIKTYRIDGETFLPGEANSHDYCELEFTRMQIGKREFFGICLEASGKNNSDIEVLESAIIGLDLLNAPFVGYPSMGYAEFLMSLRLTNG